MEQLKDILSKIPMVALLAAYALYLGYDYYEFTHDPASPLIQKQAQVDDAKKQSVDALDKIKKAQEFYASLEVRRSDLRSLAVQLNGLKATLSESLDFGSFIETVVKEANKVGLSVQGIKPSEAKESEFYTEQAFDMSFHGFYVQLVVLLDHLANLERIIRVDKFTVKASSPATAQYVDLEGTLQLKSYRYKGTKADDVGKPGASTTSTPTSPTSAAPVTLGTAPTTPVSPPAPTAVTPPSTMAPKSAATAGGHP